MTEAQVVDTDAQCARCGSSVSFEDCELCPACGYFDEPDPNCPGCRGTGHREFCLSSPEWCEAHPNSGRENVPRGAIEWFDVLADGSTRLHSPSHNDHGAGG